MRPSASHPAVAFITLGACMDAPHDEIRTPMVGLVLLKIGVILGTEHSCLFLSILRRHLLKVQNFRVGIILYGDINSLLGLQGVGYGVVWKIS